MTKGYFFGWYSEGLDNTKPEKQNVRVADDFYMNGLYCNYGLAHFNETML